ncbi:Histidine kinase-, DNA gyrase B-, and HSP90-like ATPase [Pseudarcicella hirudinis]|uniref:histidine kinase n=1 Tax=Pseudarcicella hirudinis TaxID=1079859 RepID=A0A1I5U5U7_9BACT|nr:tetratricopeptide repeat-containing sensor histidine kinase [Pseudarcicella hirudinis]SFP90653.1 Histidine kinase-, DNA gyrase B-, and HSP90-like ATPase [Pseudarcicella hirudinis]
MRKCKSAIHVLIFTIVYLISSEGICQYIPFQDITVVTNVDSLERLMKKQSGQQKLLSQLSLEKSYQNWFREKSREPFAPEKNSFNNFPALRSHLSYFLALNTRNQNDFKNSFPLALKAYREYKTHKDTTGMIHALLLMGIVSFTSEIKGAIYHPPYFMDAYKLSLATHIPEGKLMGKYARIRQFGSDSLRFHLPEIIKLCREALLDIQKNGHCIFLNPLFYSTISFAYGENKAYGLSIQYLIKQNKLLESKGIPPSIHHLNNLAYTYLKLKKYPLARKYYEMALNRVYSDKSYNYYETILYLFNSYHATLVALGEYKEASKYADSIYVYSQKNKVFENSKSINELVIKYEVKKKEADAQLLLKQKSIAEYKSKLYLVSVLLLLLIFLVVMVATIKLNQSYRKIKIANQEILHFNKLREFFYNIIAHDIRQPVSAFHGVSDTIIHYLNTKNYTKISTIALAVDESAQTLQVLLDNLLQWGIYGREKPNNPENISLDLIINETLKIYRFTIDRKSIHVPLLYNKNLMLFADKHGIFVVLRNLIGNAIKSIKNNGNLIIEAYDDSQNQIVIKISDNGVGMDEDTLAIVRQVLKQPDSVKPGERGMGLGLFLIGHFVKQNNGEIEVRSSLNKGASFILRFPSPQ